MAYTVTIRVVDCNSPTTLLAGAFIFAPGTTFSRTADVNGEAIIPVLDDFDYIITVRKSGVQRCDPAHPDHDPGYHDKNFVLDKSQDGSIQTVCLNPAPAPDPEGAECGGSGATIECFIVTAATGSNESREVTGLRRLRENVRAKSALAGRLIDAIYDDYAGFSPQIASELKGDTLSRTVVLESVVKPLFAWYVLAGKLAIGHAGPDTVQSGVRNLIDACPDYLGKTILPHLESIRKGEGLPKHAPAQFVELVPRIGQLPFATWGILDPLIRAWRSATQNLDPVDQVAQWLANAPIEALSLPDNGKLLEKELGALTHFFDFRPGARAHLGERLAAQWPHAEQALESTGFINPSQKR